MTDLFCDFKNPVALHRPEVEKVYFKGVMSIVINYNGKGQFKI